MTAGLESSGSQRSLHLHFRKSATARGIVFVVESLKRELEALGNAHRRGVKINVRIRPFKMRLGRHVPFFQTQHSLGKARSSGGGSGGGGYTIGEGLKLDAATNTLSVDTAAAVEKDNTKPVTSAAVYTEVGNINALLATI